MAKRPYKLKKGTHIRINGIEVDHNRDSRAHLVVYALSEDIIVKEGFGPAIRASVLHPGSNWPHGNIGTTFKDQYDEIISQNNREAASLYLTKE